MISSRTPQNASRVGMNGVFRIAASTAFYLSILFLVVLLSSCGRYMHPIPPEGVSPSGVRQLQVQGSIEGVSFLWMSPLTDRRGKPLNDLSGYEIGRKVIEKKGDLLNAKTKFETIGAVQDASVTALTELQDQLRAQERPAHRARIDQTLQKFQYLDTDVVVGKEYVYKIVPKSYNGDGEVKQMVRVVFRGDASEITIFLSAENEEDLTSNEFGTTPGS